VLVIIVGTGVIVYAANRKLTDVAVKTSKLSAEIEVSKKKIQTYGATQSQIESLDYVEGLAAKVLPENQEQSVVVAELSNFALRSKLTLGGIDFVDPVSTTANSKGAKTKTVLPKSVIVVPIVVTFKDANYSSLLDFLRTIETTQRKAQVSSINLTPDTENRAVLSEVVVAINLYVKKQAGQKQ
jgi:Tfp pilus assembly protein PilO